MSIYRAPRPESNWTQIRNEIIEDSRLTFKATAVLIFVLSKPDNWRTSTRHLASVKREGCHQNSHDRARVRRLHQAPKIPR